MKTILQSVGAVLAGFIFICVTHTATDAILESVGILPKGNLYVSTPMILFVLGYRAVFSVIGCYITARLAPAHPMRHALVVGAIGIVLGTIGALTVTGVGPAWYGWTLVAITLPCAWLGGMMAKQGLDAKRSEAVVSAL